MMRTYKIAVVPGDGIGREIIPVTLDVLRAGLAGQDAVLDTTEFPFGAGHYLEHGEFMTADALGVLGAFDAVLFGAVGLPEVDDTLIRENNEGEFVLSGSEHHLDSARRSLACATDR